MNRCAAASWACACSRSGDCRSAFSPPGRSSPGSATRPLRFFIQRSGSQPRLLSAIAGVRRSGIVRLRRTQRNTRRGGIGLASTSVQSFTYLARRYHPMLKLKVLSAATAAALFALSGVTLAQSSSSSSTSGADKSSSSSAPAASGSSGASSTTLSSGASSSGGSAASGGSATSGSSGGLSGGATSSSSSSPSFSSVDTNSDGQISRAEWDAHFNKSGSSTGAGASGSSSTSPSPTTSPSTPPSSGSSSGGMGSGSSSGSSGSSSGS